MGSNNGNGDKPHSVRGSPLEAVQAAIETRQAEEASTGVLSVEEVGVASEDDPLYSWKKRVEGTSVTLDVLHTGLIAVAQIAEAAIETNFKNASDLRKVIPGLELTATQVQVIASKVETVAQHVHEVDGDLAKNNNVMKQVRKDVQFMKDDISEMKIAVAALPAIKELLSEILARLPEPVAKKN